jgi:hypothetical protein
MISVGQLSAQALIAAKQSQFNINLEIVVCPLGLIFRGTLNRFLHQNSGAAIFLVAISVGSAIANAKFHCIEFFRRAPSLEILQSRTSIFCRVHYRFPNRGVQLTTRAATTVHVCYEHGICRVNREFFRWAAVAYAVYLAAVKRPIKASRRNPITAGVTQCVEFFRRAPSLELLHSRTASRHVKDACISTRERFINRSFQLTTLAAFPVKPIFFVDEEVICV